MAEETSTNKPSNSEDNLVSPPLDNPGPINPVNNEEVNEAGISTDEKPVDGQVEEKQTPTTNYVAALRADIERYTKPAVNTIQDSTIILRSLAYHTVNKTPRVVESLQDVLPSHPRFDHSIVFTSSIRSRQQRLEQRMQDNPEEVAPDDLMVIRKPEKFIAMERCLVHLAKTAFRATVIDTTELTPKEVRESVMEVVYGT